MLKDGFILVIVGIILSGMKNLPIKVWNVLIRCISVEVEIPDNEEAFVWAKNWLSRQKLLGGHKKVSLSGNSDNTESEKLSISPAPGTHFFFYRHHLSSAFRYRKELENQMYGVNSFYENIKIRFFFARSDIVAQFSKDIYQTIIKKNGYVSVIFPSYGKWDHPQFFKSRQYHSVILPDPIKKELENDIQTFFSSYSWYERCGIPYRRGYLLYGKPGNGKTSLIKALSLKLDMSIAILPLMSEFMNDTTLQQLIMGLPTNTILVFEDIDCLFANRDEENKEKKEKTKVTFSGFLNMLDGINSHENYITFFTTNHPEKLDPALKRPGRIDRSFHFDNPGQKQIQEIFSLMFGPQYSEEFSNILPTKKHSMAEIQEFLLENRHREPGEIIMVAKQHYQGMVNLRRNGQAPISVLSEPEEF